VDVSFRSEKLKTSKCFQRAELFGRQVLKLVDKKSDRHTGVLRGLSDRHDQRREVRLNVAAIGQAIFRIGVSRRSAPQDYGSRASSRLDLDRDGARIVGVSGASDLAGGDLTAWLGM
jgi:hypothetical protein